MKVLDKVLIKKTLAGSHQAFELLIERYQDFVFTLCLRVLKSREEAEEVAQDVFLKVFDKLSTFKQESSFSTWLYTLAYRTALDRLKTKKQTTYSLESEKGPLHIPTARSNEAGFSVEQKDLKKMLNIALDQLPETDASIISLFYLQDQSVKEIASVTGLSITNVKTKLFRSREKLRVLLTKDYKKEVEVELMK